MTMISNIVSTWTFAVDFAVGRGDLKLVCDMVDDVEKEGRKKLFFLIKN